MVQKNRPSFFLLGIIFMLLKTCLCLSQQSSTSYYPKLAIEAKGIYEVVVDSLYIDTLILDDQSILRFGQNNTTIIVENAYIGNNCTFDGSGRSGLNKKPGAHLNLELDGENGYNGLNLKLVIVFNSLGSLTIKTSGGNGGNGARGKDGASGQPGAIGGNDGIRGQNGGKGGDGGHGGNLYLYYSCVNFIPTFNLIKGKGKNVINLDLTGGKPGSGGSGGRGGIGGQPTQETFAGPDGKSLTAVTGVKGKDGGQGFNGPFGKPGVDGELILKKMSDER